MRPGGGTTLRRIDSSTGFSVEPKTAIGILPQRSTSTPSDAKTSGEKVPCERSPTKARRKSRPPRTFLTGNLPLGSPLSSDACLGLRSLRRGGTKSQAKITRVSSQAPAPKSTMATRNAPVFRSQPISGTPPRRCTCARTLKNPPVRGACGPREPFHLRLL